MAYLNYLASAPSAQVEAVKSDPNALIAPTLFVSVSHLIAYWVQVQPLGQLLGQAIDGGEIIHSSLQHKLRDPFYHDPDAVRSLNTQLSSEWLQVTSTQPSAPDDWYRIEIEKVLLLFGHAAERGECVVSCLDPCHVLFFKPRT